MAFIKNWLKKRSAESTLQYAATCAVLAKQTGEKEFLLKGIEALSKEIEKGYEEPTSSKLHWARATLLLQQPTTKADYEKAREDLKKVLLNNEKVLEETSKEGIDIKKEIYEDLAEVEFRLGNYDDSARYFLKICLGESVADEIESPEVLHYTKGFMFDKLGKKKDALKEYEKVIEISPDLESKSLEQLSSLQSSAPEFTSRIKKINSF